MGSQSRRNRNNGQVDSQQQTMLYRAPSLRLRVPYATLDRGVAHPFRKGHIVRLLRRLRPKPAVRVERMSVSGLSSSALYAPQTTPVGSKLDFAETELTSGRPDGSLVFQDSPFEIRVAGMMVGNFDKWNLRGNGRNELLMYSMQTDPLTSGANGEGLPFIHFDHRRDAYDRTERANTFIPIPASKAYVTSSTVPDTEDTKGKHNDNVETEENNEKQSVNVRFKIIELDEPSETVKQAIQGIDSLGGVMGMTAGAAPMLAAVSPALAVVGAVSKRALESYAQPDKVVSIDMDFLLADRQRVENGTAHPGEYLRYGYYFFLSEPVECKLYASVRTPSNLRLMMREIDETSGVPLNRFIPLTHVSYLVVRVCEPMYGTRRKSPGDAIRVKEAQKPAFVAHPEEVTTAVMGLGQQIASL